MRGGGENSVVVENEGTFTEENISDEDEGEEPKDERTKKKNRTDVQTRKRLKI